MIRNRFRWPLVSLLATAGCVPLAGDAFEGELDCPGGRLDVELHVDHFASESPFGFFGVENPNANEFAYFALAKRDIDGDRWQLDTERDPNGARFELDLTKSGKTLEGDIQIGEAECDVELDQR